MTQKPKTLMGVEILTDERVPPGVAYVVPPRAPGETDEEYYRRTAATVGTYRQSTHMIGADFGSGPDKTVMTEVTMGPDDLLTFTPFDEDDDIGPSDEDMKDHWAGEGHVEFYVSANRPDVFEIDELDHSGCVGGALEGFFGMGDFLDHLGIDREELREGWTYTVCGITASFYRGDGWTTDDDAEYNYHGLVASRDWKRWAKQKIVNAWWFSIGWRIAMWSRGRKA